MPKHLELLLVENVDNLGIVGDVVKVRTGYARNFLLPRSLATVPSEELVKSLQAKRAEAEKQLAENRKQREATIGKLAGYEITMTRSCNDQGILYAAVTQNEIAESLTAAGFHVRPRDVRIPGAIKRVDNYHITIKFDADLETAITLHVKADRELKQEDRVEMEFDNEGNLIQPGSARARKMQEADEKAAAKRAERRAKLMGSEEGPREVVVGWGKKPAAPAEGEAKDKADKKDAQPKAEKADKPAKDKGGDKADKKDKAKK